MAKFELKPEQVKVIARALDTLPLADNAEVVFRIQEQIDALTGTEWDELRSSRVAKDLT